MHIPHHLLRLLPPLLHCRHTTRRSSCLASSLRRRARARCWRCCAAWMPSGWRARWPACRWAARSCCAPCHHFAWRCAACLPLAQPIPCARHNHTPVQVLGEGQELPAEVVAALFEGLTYDALLQGAPTPCVGMRGTASWLDGWAC